VKKEIKTSNLEEEYTRFQHVNQRDISQYCRDVFAISLIFQDKTAHFPDVGEFQFIYFCKKLCAQPSSLFRSGIREKSPSVPPLYNLFIAPGHGCMHQ